MAPLRQEQSALLDRKTNPFFRRGDAAFFLARREGKPVGRISAHYGLPMAGIDTRATGTFGFFECEENQETAAALFAAAERWLADRGARRALGPMSFSLNHECGLLIEGYDTPPYLLMAHNPPRYVGLIERLGYLKEKDLLAWNYTLGRIPPEMHRLAERAREKTGVTIRSLDPKRFTADTTTVLRLFNEAWKDNWGFTPMIEEEFAGAVRELRRIVDPELVLIAEKEGRPIAIAVTLPNLNEALVGLGGRLLPTGFLRLLWRLKVRGVATVRCLMLGIDPEHRRFASLGLSVLLYCEMDAAGVRRGIRQGEISWTLEDNGPINRGVAALGAVPYKRYRLYARSFAS